MSKKLIRSSLFISLMLIVSITLSGCNVNFANIVSGLKNTLGKVVSNVGNVIGKAVNVARKVVSVVKNVADPVIKAYEDISGKKTSAGEKIDKGLGKIGNVLDKLDGFGNKVVDAGGKLSKNAKNQAGAPTQVIPNPREDSDELQSGASDSPGNRENRRGNRGRSIREIAEDIREAIGDKGKVEIVNQDDIPASNWNRNSNNANNSRVPIVSREKAEEAPADELLTKEEKKEMKTTVAGGLDSVSKGVNELIGIFSDGKLPWHPAYSLRKGLISCRKRIEEIKKEPINVKTLKKMDALKRDLNNLKKTSGKFIKDYEELTKLVMVDAIGTIEKGLNEISVAAIEDYKKNR